MQTTLDRCVHLSSKGVLSIDQWSPMILSLSLFSVEQKLLSCGLIGNLSSKIHAPQQGIVVSKREKIWRISVKVEGSRRVPLWGRGPQSRGHCLKGSLWLLPVSCISVASWLVHLALSHAHLSAPCHQLSQSARLISATAAVDASASSCRSNHRLKPPGLHPRLIFHYHSLGLNRSNNAGAGHRFTEIASPVVCLTWTLHHPLLWVYQFLLSYMFGKWLFTHFNPLGNQCIDQSGNTSSGFSLVLLLIICSSNLNHFTLFQFLVVSSLLHTSLPFSQGYTSKISLNIASS